MNNYKGHIIQLNVILIVVLKRVDVFSFFLENELKKIIIKQKNGNCEDCDFFMGEYIRGVVVKLHLTTEQEVFFKKNYGCTRKTYNELLNKYKAKYGDDSTKVPTRNELNQFLKESRKELHYLGDGVHKPSTSSR